MPEQARKIKQSGGSTVAIDFTASHWPVSILFGTSSLLSIFLPIILVRHLGTSEIGVFKIFFLYLTLIPELFFASGLVSGLAYWIGRGEQGANALGLSLKFILSLGLIVFLLMLVSSSQIADVFEVSQVLVVLFAFGTLAMITSPLYEEVNIYLGRTWPAALFHSAFALIRAALMVTAAIVFGLLEGVLIAHVVATLAKTMLGSYLLGRQGALKSKWNRSIIVEIFRYSIPVGLAASLAVIAAKADQLLLSNVLDTSVFALYAIGCFALPPIFILEQSITRLLVPRLSACFSNFEGERAVKLYRAAVQELAFWIIPAVVGLIVFAEPLIVMLFTEQYQAASVYLQVFALTYLSMVFPFDVSARARADGKWILVTAFSSAILSLAICSVLILYWGALGGLMGLILTRFSIALWGMHYHLKYMQSSISRLIPIEQIVKFTTLSCLLGVVSLSVRDLFLTEIIWLLVCAPIFFLTYTFFRLLLKVEMDPGDFSQPAAIVIAETLDTGGLERVVVDLAKGLNQLEIARVLVVAYNQGWRTTALSRKLDKDGIELLCLNKGEGFKLRISFQIAKYAIKNRVQLIHTHDLNALIYGGIAKLLMPWSTALMHTQHTFSHLLDSKKYRLYERILSFLCDRTVAVSETLKGEFQAINISQKNYSVISNGITLQEPISASDGMVLHQRVKLIESIEDPQLKTQMLQSIGDVWMISLGRLSPVKGQDRLIEAWKSLARETRSGFRLFIVGPASDPDFTADLLKCCNEAPDPERITLLPTYKNGPEWISACEVFISLSRAEGHPIAALEAAQLGKKLILSDIPAHRSSFNRADFISFELLSSLDPVLKSYLSNNNDDWEERERLAETLRLRYSSERMVRAYAELYSELLNRDFGEHFYAVGERSHA